MMHDVMTQEDAMRMNNEQAIQILKPFRDMMFDQHGCPISDAVFALDKAIEALEQSQWIPISKEPDIAKHVLVTAKWGEDDYEVFETDYWVVKNGANDPTWKYQAENKRELDHITAWQHMPEPWKGEDE